MKGLLVILILIFGSGLYCQQSDVYRFNYENQFFNNPSTVQNYDPITLTGMHQMNFTGIDRAPRTIAAGLQIPFYKTNTSFGLALISQKSGLINDTKAQIAGSYRVRMNNRGFIAMGLGVIPSTISIRADMIPQSVTIRDPTISNQQLYGSNMDFTMGASYSSISPDVSPNTTHFQIGVAYTNVVLSNISLQNAQYQKTSQINGLFKFYYKRKKIIGYNSNKKEGPLIRCLLDVVYSDRRFFNYQLALSGVFVEQGIDVGLGYNSEGFLLIEAGISLSEVVNFQLAGNSFHIAVSGGFPTRVIAGILRTPYTVKLKYTFERY